MYSAEQSTGFFDHDNMYYNLGEINKQHLISKRQHVSRLILAMKIVFWGFKLDHGLSSMHRLLRPEDRYLINDAHQASPNEEMLFLQQRSSLKVRRTS